MNTLCKRAENKPFGFGIEDYDEPHQNKPQQN